MAGRDPVTELIENENVRYSVMKFVQYSLLILHFLWLGLTFSHLSQENCYCKIEL